VWTFGKKSFLPLSGYKPRNIQPAAAFPYGLSYPDLTSISGAVVNNEWNSTPTPSLRLLGTE
jgi:hypothetical protein